MKVLLLLQKRRKFNTRLEQDTCLSVSMFSYSVGLLGLLMSVVLPNSALAAAGFDKLLNLPLKALMNVKVDVASKRPESILWSPASISTYTKKDIRALSYYNLAELAAITPGYSVYTDIGENTLETRGQRATGFDNNRHLLLIDGIPMNHLRSSALQADQNLPLYFAEQVDFLRGPASALYGVSAFYGVVSIKPTELMDTSQRFDLRLSQGNHDNDKQVLLNYLRGTSGGKGGVRIGYYEKEASADMVGGDAAHRNYDDQQSLFAYGSWSWTEGWLSGFKTGLILMEKRGGLGNFWADYSSEKNEITWENYVWYGKYQYTIAPSLGFNSFLKYAQSGEAATVYDETETLRSNYDYRFHSYEGQVELHWSISAKNRLLGGINYDTRYGERAVVTLQNNPAVTERTPDLNTYSMYLQYKHQLEVLDRAEITLGVREDRGEAGEDSYSKLSPRLAYVQGFSPRSTLKLLYGEALRGPSIKEIGVNAEVARDNPAVRLSAIVPEEIATIELVKIYQADDWLGSITLFHNETENFLGRDFDNLGEYINSVGVTRSKGGELEVKYFLARGDQIFINCSLAKTKDPQGDDLEDLPTQKLNIGWLWENLSDMPVSGALVGRWIRGYAVADKGAENNSSSFVLDINGKYKMSKHLTLALEIRNLFDKEYSLPRQGEENLKMPQQTAMFSMELAY